jgi:spore coat polysaccharide biosynthesis protein SpsF (cytidylyltransferase family)
MEKLPETTNINTAVRLTLDYEEDYWLLMSISRILGNNPDRNKVMQLFLDNPDMAKINLFRNDEWKAAQLSKNF